MPGLQTNSLDKIAKVYFAGVTAQPFEYRGETFNPKEVHVSPHIFRGTTCPSTCGGCCFRFSLTYLPHDPSPESEFLRPQTASCNGVTRQLIVDTQQDHSDHFCRHLIKSNGRCGIHGVHPFTCDFETIRFSHQEHRVDIANRLFGRGWSYTRVTGQTGALCDILPPSLHHRDEAVRKLGRLKEWSDYFNLKTHLPQIIDWVAAGPHSVPLHIGGSRRNSLLDLIQQSNV